MFSTTWMLSLLETGQLIILFHAHLTFSMIYEKNTTSLPFERNRTFLSPSNSKRTLSLTSGENKTFSSLSEQNKTFSSPFERNETFSALFERNKSSPLSSKKTRTLSLIFESKGNLLLPHFNETSTFLSHSNASNDANRTRHQNALSFKSSGSKLNIISLNSENITILDKVPIKSENSQWDHRTLPFKILEIRTLPDINSMLLDTSNKSMENENLSISMNIGNGSFEFNESRFTFESWYYITHHFECNLNTNDELIVSCKNVSIYDLAKYIPNDTVSLEITNSRTVCMLKPLFLYLTKLKYLRLSSNEHRFITKAFVGLETLQHLDLSNNNIMAIKNAFTYLTNLKHLNLSRNSIIIIGRVADALKGLSHLETLVLNHNWRIFRIRQDELKPLKNTNITKLYLFNTTLSIVERGAFAHLHNLELMDLSVNYLTETALTNVTSSLTNTSIKYLYMQQWVHLNNLPSEALRFLENTSIYRLDLSHNYFLKIHKLPYIPSLRSLWLSHCSIQLIDYGLISQLPNLTELVLANNNLISFKASASKSLKTLILSQQATRYEKKLFQLSDFAFINASEIELIDLSGNLFPVTLHRYVLFGLKNLKYLSLKSVGLFGIEDFSFETLNTLKTLNLQINGLRYLSNETFFGLNSLTDLYLSRNRLILPDGFNPFHFTPSLINILLDNNRIEKIPRDTFAYTEHLGVLILSRNKISPWNEPIFSENSTVATFGVSQNQIDYVTPTMLSDLRKITSYLDIGRNPFNCSKCGMKNFQSFLNATDVQMGLPVPTDRDNATVKCSLPNMYEGQQLIKVDVSFTDCLDFEEILSISTIVLISLPSVFVTTAAYSCYIFRWYLRYWLFHLKSEVKERRTSNSKSEKTYKYDAFVAYNSNDAPWIVSFLIPALENEYPNLKLCIHDRDFEVGRLITENILEAIENSKKVMLILTEEFVKSEWCMFELHMAQHRLFDETRDCLILIKLKQVNRKFYTKNLKYLERTRTCLLWPDTLMDQKLFLEKIRKLLGYSLSLDESKVKGLEQC